jgi:hypothetical protein
MVFLLVVEVLVGTGAVAVAVVDNYRVLF